MLYLAFFLSGAAGLIFERLWFHQAGLALGNSIWASSLVLAGFMGGLALGNLLAARLGPRLARPLRAYALLELAVACAGVTLVVVLPALTSSLALVLRSVLEQPVLLGALRAALAFALLLVPATAMGATLPVVVDALWRRDPRYGRAVGLLYGVNTLGAVAGVVAAETVFLPLAGVRGSALLAGACALLAAALAASLARHAHPPLPVQTPGPSGPGPRILPLLAVAFLCGLVLLALEVVWFRFLLLFLSGTGLAFAMLLALVLAGIALGGLAGSAWLARNPEASRQLPAACLSAAALCCLSYAGFDGVLRRASALEGWREALALGAPLVLPSAFLSGILFPLVGAGLHRGAAGGAARSTGLLNLANTTGAALGSLIAGFALLPGLGIERSLQVLASLYLLGALLAAAGRLWPRDRRERIVLGGCAVGCLLALALFPAGAMRERFLRYPVEPFRRSEGAVPVAIREGLTETAILLQVDRFGKPFYHRLLTNSFSMSATHFRSQRYMRLFVYLPLALHPRPESALLLCYGVGVTAKALTDTAELRSIEVVDTSREILDLAPLIYPDPKEQPLRDPRVRVHVEDARHFLQTTVRRFDIVTGEPPPPGMAGVESLYSVEFFRLLRERLEPGGIASYWLPVTDLHEHETRAIVRGFCAAFSDCSLWSGSAFNWILLGTNEAQGPVSLERFRRQWDDPDVGRTLRALAIEEPEQLGALFLAGAADLLAWTRDTPPLDDDHPKRIGDRRADPRAVAPAYRRFADAGDARTRFARSELVRRLWPAALREPALEAFELQRIVNAVSYQDAIDPSAVLPMLHRVLADPRLRALPMFLLGNTADPGGREGAAASPTSDFLLGIQALSERDYARAAARFERSRARGDTGRRTTCFLLYALAREGQTPRALELAHDAGISGGETAEDERVLRFFAETLGLDLRSGAGTR